MAERIPDLLPAIEPPGPFTQRVFEYLVRGEVSEFSTPDALRWVQRGVLFVADTSYPFIVVATVQPLWAGTTEEARVRFQTSANVPEGEGRIRITGDSSTAYLLAERSLDLPPEDLYRAARNAAMVEPPVKNRPMLFFTLTSAYSLEENLRDWADFAAGQNEQEWVANE